MTAVTLSEWIAANEPWLRGASFIAVLITMALWEYAAPRRTLTITRAQRWPNNLGIVVLNTIVLRLIFPTAAVGMAAIASAGGFGLLNLVELPFVLATLLAILVLDGAIYLQHVMFHAVPLLWRLHRMHHTDLEFDTTTGLRFHPLETLISMGLKIAVVAALGPPVVAVTVFEILLNATSLFNHGNVRLGAPFDRVLRWIVVTPDMHRVHHSVRVHETNSNFGFNLPWWDRLLGTYRAQPQDGHEAMTIGIEDFRDAGDLRLDRMLVQPMVGAAGTYPINRQRHD